MNALKPIAIVGTVILATPTIAVANSYTLYRSPHAGYSTEGDEKIMLAVFDVDFHSSDSINELFNETYCERAATLLQEADNEADDVEFWCERADFPRPYRPNTSN